MQPASGSEFYPARDARTPLTRGFLLGHRHRTQANEQLSPVPSLLNPHNPPASRGTSSHSRRKRSTETALLTDQDGGGKAQQENKRIRASCCHPIHSLQSSTTRSELRTAPKTGDIDLITLRVKVRQFSATARSATGACTASTSAFVPACCSGKSFSSHKSRSTSVFKPLHSTNVTSPFEDNSGGRSSTSASTLPSRSRSRIKFRAVKPGKSKGSETNNSDTASPFSPFPSSSSSPARSPSSFDVGRANTVTCTTPTRDRLDSFFDLSPSSSFQFPSFDALDDLTRWGMDTMTYLSTAPNNDLSNVEQTTTTNSISNSKNPPFSNPFSTPFGDDDYLENEIPFPSTRPRVVLEPMGVKKSKTLAADKARNLAATCAGLASHSRSRYLHPFIPYELPRPAPVLKNPSIPQSPSRPPPVLPHPLPPLQSGETPSPLSEDSLARTSSYLQRLVEPSQSSFPSATTDSRNVSELDANRPSSSPGTFSPSNQSPNSQSSSSPSGPPSALEIENEEPRVTLGGSLQRKLTPLFTPPNGKDSLRPRLEDFELSVMFPQTAHYEVWDMSDHGWVSVPALLCLMVKDPKQWTATPLSTPDVSLIELKCDDIPLPVRYASLCPDRRVMPAVSPSQSPPHLSPFVSCRPNTYSTTFLGGKSALNDPASTQNGTSKNRVMSMMDAMKKHDEEQKMGKDKISLEGKWTKTFGLPGVGGCDIKRTKSGSSTSLPARGWYLKFWIPIPTRLFLKRETRIFKISAQIWMVDQKEERFDRFETGLKGVNSGWSTEDGVPSLEAETRMTVSHLRKERDMDWWWW